MQKPARGIKGVRMAATTAGIAAGIGVSYLMLFLDDRISIPEGIPSLIWMLILVLLPIILIGVIVLVLWIQKPLSDEAVALREFAGYFGISFFFLYYATYTLVMLNRVG